MKTLKELYTLAEKEALYFDAREKKRVMTATAFAVFFAMVSIVSIIGMSVMFIGFVTYFSK